MAAAKGPLFYCRGSDVKQLTAHRGPEHKRVEWPGKHWALSFTFPLPAQPLHHHDPLLTPTTTTTGPSYPQTSGPRPRCNASLIALCSINCQQREKADTNKGDLAQRDAERLLSLVRSGDQSRDLTERDSWPLVHWQWLY